MSGMLANLSAIDNSQQFEALFNYATIGIVVTNAEGDIINFNKFAEEQFGYKTEELLGKKVEVLLPQNVHHRHTQYRENYYQNPEPRIMGHGRDLYAMHKNGKNFPVEVSLSHYKINGQTFVLAFVIDISVRKKQEEVVLQQKHELERISNEIREMNVHLEQKIEDRTKMLREALSELEKSKEELSEAYENEKELSELKSRFVTMASHEFRTPLSAILSSAYLLEKYNQVAADAKVYKHIHRIKTAVGGMKSILEDFLSLGKLEEGQIQTLPETISCDQFIIKVNELLQEMEAMAKAGQKIIFHANLKQSVTVDTNLIRNILANLVSNAIKFSLENTTIDITCNVIDNNLVIEVADKGMGISAEDQEHLFERFFRARNASNIQGTGLGLHIVGKYLELMNGRIELSSKLDEGSTFTIYIPQ